MDFMKTALLSIALALCVFSPACRADFIVGSVGFNFSTDPFDSAAGMAVERAVKNVETRSERSGFFSQGGGFPVGTAWSDFNVPDFYSADKSLVISNSDFGTFTATVLSDMLISSSTGGTPTGRNINYRGMWLPGTNPKFAVYTDPVVAELALTLITTSLSDKSVVTGVMVFAAHGAAVPEPGSLLLLGAVSVAVPLRRRWKRGTTAVATAAENV
jgi:hypothetical protein